MPVTDASAEGVLPRIVGGAGRPKVVELFQSPGCRSCAPVNANPDGIVRHDPRRRLVAITIGENDGRSLPHR